jgi:hypothetical protein
MLNYPLTRKAKIQRHSISQDIPLNMAQQFATPSALLPNKHSGDMPFSHNDMVIIWKEFLKYLFFFSY